MISNVRLISAVQLSDSVMHMYPGFPGSSMVKNRLQCGRPGFDPWVRKIPWRRKWQPTPVFLPGKSHGQRSLAGYGPWGHKESDMTSNKHFHFFSFSYTHTHTYTHTDTHTHKYIYMYTYILFIFFSIMVYHRTLNTVPGLASFLIPSHKLSCWQFWGRHFYTSSSILPDWHLEKWVQEELSPNHLFHRISH